MDENTDMKFDERNRYLKTLKKVLIIDLIKCLLKTSGKIYKKEIVGVLKN